MKNISIKSLILCIFLLSITLLITSCNKGVNKFITLNYDFYLDTSSYITIEYNTSETNEKKIKEDVNDEIRNIFDIMENTFSPSKKESELSKLNTDNNLHYYDHDYLVLLYLETIEYSNKYPLFDVTIGSLTNLWNISKQAEYCYINDNCIVPSEEDIEKNKKLVNYKDVNIDNVNRIISLKEGMKLDFGACVKGYTADMIRNLLKNKGYNFFVINLGGNVIVEGSSKIYQENKKKVNVSIENPFDSTTLLDIYPINQTIVTSGINKRYIEKNGIKYHHILDKNTGYPVDNEIEQVTIITTSSFKADILSTVCLLSGLDKSIDILKNEDVSGIIVTKDKKIYIINYENEYKLLNNDFTIINNGGQ